MRTPRLLTPSGRRHRTSRSATARSNVTAASTVSPLVYAPSAPGSETSATASTDGAAAVPFATAWPENAATSFPAASLSGLASAPLGGV